MDQFFVMRSVKKDVEGVWCKCRWCGNLYGPNVTRITQHFTNEFAPRQRGNATSSRALDEEEREIESALPGSIIKEEPIEGGRLPSARATGIRPQQSNFSSPSIVANADTSSNNNVQGSQSFPKHAATSTQRRTVQLSIKPMMDAA
ncbi:hypothetical protein R1sor_014701 [Riccia sorocarpa]|uniref:BED-type domain-containing protein n=1 Tax=Riccia sorocarpa TaxID=122646 RepID=A0ABD3HD48_9MARC